MVALSSTSKCCVGAGADPPKSHVREGQFMLLQSKLFRGDPKLEACLLHDRAHVLRGAVGNHVGKIQAALFTIDGLVIEPSELVAKRFGISTEAAVLAFKKKRHIINHTYQTTEDNIVGRMTIAALDREMLSREVVPPGRCRIVPIFPSRPIQSD